MQSIIVLHLLEPRWRERQTDVTGRDLLPERVERERDGEKECLCVLFFPDSLE